jgi:hypothetical protein
MDSAFQNLGLELAVDAVTVLAAGGLLEDVRGSMDTRLVGDTMADLNRAEAERAQRHVQGFRDQIDRLTLINMAVWSLLKDKTGLTEKDLMDRVRQIDLTDGKEDGRVRKQLSKCPKCERTMSPRHSRCMYCGAEGLIATAFDPVL